MITTRRAIRSDLILMRQLFYDTILSVCAKDYAIAQIQVWADAANNVERWEHILAEQWVLLAVQNRIITGFITLAGRDKVDLLYVHKDFQRRGVASLLYEAAEDKARQSGATSIWSEVSITAKSFFERKGFTVIAEQKPRRNDVTLVNYKMIKQLK